MKLRRLEMSLKLYAAGICHGYSFTRLLAIRISLFDSPINSVRKNVRKDRGMQISEGVPVSTKDCYHPSSTVFGRFRFNSRV